jgi:hypothetical protein
MRGPMILKQIKGVGLGAILAAGLTLVAASADAAILPAPVGNDAGIVKIAQGCGPGRWRGPGGWCRGPGYGPGPGWGWHRHCWRGPYGHLHCN